MENLRTLLRLSRPIFLALAALAYGLGLGVARYLGTTFHQPVIYLGAGFVLFTLAAAGLLVDHFRPPLQPIIPTETLRERETLRRLLLVVALSLLGAAGLCALVLIILFKPSLLSVLLMAIYAILSLSVAVPPVRLEDRGFGELARALLIVTLPPILAFTFQAGELHRLVTFLSFPLTLLGITTLLALNFSSFAADQKYERRTLLIQLTWQRAIPMHHTLMISAYMLLLTAPYLGIPFVLIWPALLTLPLAFYQMVMLHNIGQGLKPNWEILVINAIAILGVTTYLLTLTFWLR